MKIAINASAAFKERRTGVEEYTYQLIKHLALLKESEKHHFLLYLPFVFKKTDFDFKLPANFEIRRLRWFGPMWTQARLALEILVNQPDVFFIPVHVLPLVHPRNSLVTIHGLEYEYYPQMYPKKHLRYLRFSTKFALKKARKIVAASENTKKDLIDFYGGEEKKIKVIHHGVNLLDGNKTAEGFLKNNLLPDEAPYIFFIGRLEIRKNLEGLIDAFYLLKKEYGLPHKLVLAGNSGFGFERILKKAREYFTYLNQEIIFPGYLYSNRWQSYRNAAAFVLPSFYEGFGLPILEAQAAGCPVITSDVSSMPEVAGGAALLVNPEDHRQIAAAIYRVIKDSRLRRRLIQKGYHNIKRFSWEKCARETLELLTDLSS